MKAVFVTHYFSSNSFHPELLVFYTPFRFKSKSNRLLKNIPFFFIFFSVRNDPAHRLIIGGMWN